VVVPLEVPDLIRFSQWSRSLIKNRIPLPSEESVLLCDDKYKFNQTLIDRGFGTFVPRMGIRLEPPYILKNRTGNFGQECWLIRDRNEERGILDKLNTPAFLPGVLPRAA
jgi:hypothetical protein